MENAKQEFNEEEYKKTIDEDMVDCVEHIGTKIIYAKPMELEEYNSKYNRAVPNRNGSDGYLVIYEVGGYRSWSPKDVFELAYKKSGNLSFGDAIQYLKLGKKVARSGWNGKGMYLLLVSYSNSEEWEDNLHYHLHNINIEGLPWIGMKTADNKFVPWLASQTDMLSEDWIILNI